MFWQMAIKRIDIHIAPYSISTYPPTS